MWNLVCSNSILDKRAKYKAHLKHMEALKSVKATINNKTPHKPVFLLSKQKTRLMRLEKNEEIQNHNNILVNHMQKIEPTVWDYNDVYYRVKSITQSKPYKKRQEKEVDEGNEIMIRKLHDIESDYKVYDILRDTNSHIQYKNNIMTSNKNSNSIYNASYISSRTRPFSAKSRPSSAPNRR